MSYNRKREDRVKSNDKYARDSSPKQRAPYARKRDNNWKELNDLH